MAGMGTRMLPATKVVPKELLPVAGKPVIQLIVEEAVGAGFSEIIFVTNSSKVSIESHFKTSSELEDKLKKQLKSSLLKEIKEISRLEVKIVNIEQKEPKGLGHAILSAKSLISKEPFAVMLPDMIIEPNHTGKNFALMKENFERTGHSSILLGKVKKSEVQNYGIAKFNKKAMKDIFFRLDDIIEKPSSKKAPSNFFVVGRYVFDNEILVFLDKEKPDSTGEIQLTGAVSKYLKSSKKQLNGLLLEGNFYDCGNKIGYLIANLAFSFKDNMIKKEVLKYLKKQIV